MTNLEESQDRSSLMAAALISFIVLTFLAAAQWVALNWALITGSGKTPVVVIPVPEPTRPVGAGPRSPLIAVSIREQYDQYDDIGAVLERMGQGYEFDKIPLRQLGDYKRLCRYKVLFLGCAAELAPADFTMREMERFLPISILNNPSYVDGVRRALSTFVQEGGALYASDWAATLLELAVPELIPISRTRYPRQVVEAKVLDKGLQDLIGSHLELNFDTDLWVAAEPPMTAQVHLEGEVRDASFGASTRPLLVSARRGRGQVIFTSFHNEKQLSKKEQELLKYLVLKPIIAAAAHQTQQVLVSQNFAVQKESLFSTGSGSPKVFPYTATAGQELTFVLAWNVPAGGEKAELELAVTSPSGKVLTRKAEAPPVKVDVGKAEAGDYTYSVNPITVPHGNFPYVVSVGVKR